MITYIMWVVVGVVLVSVLPDILDCLIYWSDCARRWFQELHLKLCNKMLERKLTKMQRRWAESEKLWNEYMKDKHEKEHRTNDQ